MLTNYIISKDSGVQKKYLRIGIVDYFLVWEDQWLEVCHKKYVRKWKYS